MSAWFSELRLRQGVFLAIAAACLSPWASPPLALFLGVALAVVIDHPFRDLGRKSTKWLLQSSVVLLGFGMNLPAVLRAGMGGALLGMATISVTLTLGYFLGRWLKIGGRTALLISAGTAICGGSAIAAVSTAIDAEEGDVTVALGTVFMFNAAALYLFPIIGRALGLSPHQFGTWAGMAIHDVSSVVGAASRFGAESLQTAAAVKLARALWIVPVVAAAAIMARRQRSDSAPEKSKAASRLSHFPWFIGLFVLASTIRSFVPGVAQAAPALTHLATMGLTLTLFLIGASLSMKTLRSVGFKSLLLGLILWATVSAGSLLAIHYLA